MSSMVTVTHNNRVPELLAVIRRGPFAPPTQSEKIEYLLTRTPKSQSWTSFADYALEHVLSYQRRVLSIKAEFLKRCARTPLGICHDYWDRTEALLLYHCILPAPPIHNYRALCCIECECAHTSSEGSATRFSPCTHSRVVSAETSSQSLGGTLARTKNCDGH